MSLIERWGVAVLRPAVHGTVWEPVITQSETLPERGARESPRQCAGQEDGRVGGEGGVPEAPAVPRVGLVRGTRGESNKKIATR